MEEGRLPALPGEMDPGLHQEGRGEGRGVCVQHECWPMGRPVWVRERHLSGEAPTSAPRWDPGLGERPHWVSSWVSTPASTGFLHSKTRRFWLHLLPGGLYCHSAGVLPVTWATGAQAVSPEKPPGHMRVVKKQRAAQFQPPMLICENTWPAASEDWRPRLFPPNSSSETSSLPFLLSYLLSDCSTFAYWELFQLVGPCPFNTVYICVCVWVFP